MSADPWVAPKPSPGRRTGGVVLVALLCFGVVHPMISNSYHRLASSPDGRLDPRTGQPLNPMGPTCTG
jgi:hypothetical protein